VGRLIRFLESRRCRIRHARAFHPLARARRQRLRKKTEAILRIIIMSTEEISLMVQGINQTGG
jgi:hypothetical protein